MTVLKNVRQRVQAAIEVFVENMHFGESIEKEQRFCTRSSKKKELMSLDLSSR